METVRFISILNVTETEVYLRLFYPVNRTLRTLMQLYLGPYPTLALLHMILIYTDELKTGRIHLTLFFRKYKYMIVKIDFLNVLYCEISFL